MKKKRLKKSLPYDMKMDRWKNDKSTNDQNLK